MPDKILREKTLKLLQQSPLPGGEIDTKVLQLLKSEYLRLLVRYRRMDFIMNSKYAMSFDEFVKRKIVRQKGYTWDVESDAMEWETAISGMKTTKRKLRELEELSID